MEPKLDGIRCIAFWEGDDIRMISRSAKTELGPKVPHLVKSLEKILPWGMMFDGELGIPHDQGWRSLGIGWPIIDFNKTVRVTQSGVDEALSKQKHPSVGPLHYYIFDFTYMDTVSSEPQTDRTRVAMNLLSRDPHDLIHPVIPVFSGWINRIYDNYVVDGGEGVILKNPKGLYVMRKRPAKTWYKIKKFDSFDGKIVGYDEGLGKYDGQIGALVIETPQGVLVRCSGMDDATRQYMTKYWSKYYGHMAEIKYFGRVGSVGKGYRHPQFLRMRPDLD